MHLLQREIQMQSNAAKRLHAFNPSRYERVFDVRLVLSGTVYQAQATLYLLQGVRPGPLNLLLNHHCADQPGSIRTVDCNGRTVQT